MQRKATRPFDHSADPELPGSGRTGVKLTDLVGRKGLQWSRWALSGGGSEPLRTEQRSLYMPVTAHHQAQEAAAGMRRITCSEPGCCADEVRASTCLLYTSDAA